MDSQPRSSLAAIRDPASSKAFTPGGAVDGWRAVVLVEGVSDQSALDTLAERRGRDLHNDGVAVVPMGGATNIGHFLDLLGPRGLGLELAGLCDVAEEGVFRRGLERADLGSCRTRGDLEQRGFFVCVADLEDELIRALGVGAVKQVIEAQGELKLFRTFQNQPAQRARSPQAQLRRFMGTLRGRKIRYAHLLTEALDLTHIPRPLERVLTHI